VSGVGCQGTEVLSPETLCETSCKYKSEPQNIEQEISNDEVWNRFVLTIFEKFKSIEYLTSKFIIPCSIFDICFSKFLFRSDWSFFGPTAALNPDTRLRSRLKRSVSGETFSKLQHVVRKYRLGRHRKVCY